MTPLGTYGFSEANLKPTMQGALGSYASAGGAVNCASAVWTLEAAFFIRPPTCEDLDKSYWGPGGLLRRAWGR